MSQNPERPYSTITEAHNRKAEANRRRREGKETRININELNNGKYAVFRDGDRVDTFDDVREADRKGREIAEFWAPSKVIRIVDDEHTVDHMKP